MVPRGRLELPRLAALPPQSSVSTNSTTWARRFFYAKYASIASFFFQKLYFFYFDFTAV